MDFLFLIFLYAMNAILEYNNPNDKRFHSETICCKNCGPKYYIVDKERININTSNQLSLTSKLIAEGSIVAVKGIGGFHLITSAFNYESISKLRLIKNRKNKPFAVMAKDIDTLNLLQILILRRKNY